MLPLSCRPTQYFLIFCKRNDPDAKSSPLVAGFNVINFVNSWKKKVQRFEITEVGHRSADKTGQRYVEFNNVVNDSRDRFSAERSYDFFRLSIPLAGAAGSAFGIPGSTFWAEFWAARRGGTDHVLKQANRAYRWNWTSADTFSFWVDYKYIRIRWGVPKERRRQKEAFKLGWGGAHALQKDIDPVKSDYYDYRSRRNVTERTLANSVWNQVDGSNSRSLAAWGGAWQNPGSAGNLSTRSWTNTDRPADIYNNLTHIDGVREFYDLKHDDKSNYGPEFSLIIQKPGDKISAFGSSKDPNKQNTHSQDNKQFDLASAQSIPKGSLFALATARPEFSRADEILSNSKGGKWAVQWGRKDGLHEYGNFYNPFWETKLIARDNNLLKFIFSS